MAVSAKTCNQENCQLATNGRCKEGFPDPDQCPYVVAVAKPAKAGGIPRPARIAAADARDLPKGDAQTAAAAASITRARRTRVIILIGDEESGKTTLLASLYEQFQRGPYAGYLFAGTETFPGLEERCYLSRISAEQQEARTGRTHPGEGMRFLHMQLRPMAGTALVQDLLFSDVSGELLRQACESREEAQKLGAI